MSKFTHLCLPVSTGSRLDAYDNPHGYVVSIEDLNELKPVLQAAFAFGLSVSPDYFRHVEIEWRRGDWVTLCEEMLNTTQTFQEKDPLEAGWATDFSDIAPLDGFAVRAIRPIALRPCLSTSLPLSGSFFNLSSDSGLNKIGSTGIFSIFWGEKHRPEGFVASAQPSGWNGSTRFFEQTSPALVAQAQVSGRFPIFLMSKKTILPCAFRCKMVL